MNLDNILLRETNHEIKQKIQHKFIQDYPFEYADNLSYIAPKINKELFFKNKRIFISKHSRYAPYPKHSHQFFEMNYLYKGTCNQIINGNRYTLNEGDILLLDENSEHSIESMGYNDILINIIFEDKSINLFSLRNIRKSKSILYTFLLNNFTTSDDLQNYLIIKDKENDICKEIINMMIQEYYCSDDF